ncbi:MAG: dephospho-CoA kinase [Planctomycetota bacterium]|jgi:dephospho-CoA kinase
MTSPDSMPPNPRSTVIGLLGGVASGKSAVAHFLAGKLGVVISADGIAGEVLALDETAAWLRLEFGADVLTASGEPDREALGAVIFSDSEARERLESWIHPRVRERIAEGLEQARANQRTPIVLDVPLLLEHEDAHGLTGECDFLVFIETDAKDRERRAQEHRGWSAGEVKRREQVQIPLSEKRNRAQHVIENKAGLAELEARVHEVLEAEQLPY